MNKRQFKKHELKFVTLINRETGNKTKIRVEDFIALVKIAGFTREEFKEWLERED